MTERDFQRRFACITFDDGYRDLMQWAYPVLRKHDVPFALYVPTSFPDRIGELWWLALERVVAENQRSRFGWTGRTAISTARPPQKSVTYTRNSIGGCVRAKRKTNCAMPCETCATRYGVDMKSLLRGALHDLGRDRDTGARSAGHDRRAYRQSRHPEENIGPRGAIRTGNGPRGDRSRDRRAPGTSRLSGRRPDIGRRARISSRQGSGFQDRNDDQSRRPVSRNTSIT